MDTAALRPESPVTRTRPDRVDWTPFADASRRLRAVPSDGALARHDSLIRMTHALAAHRDRDDLLRALPHELRGIVRFGALTLGVYDENSASSLEIFVLNEEQSPLRLNKPGVGESLAYWAGQQQPVVVPSVSEEAGAREYLQTPAVASACLLPLATPRRRIGILVLGSNDRNAYEAQDTGFLSLVAGHVALAFERVLDHAALERALLVHRERVESLETSDELLRALSPVLDIREVFPQVSEIAAKVLPHDLLTMTFHDQDGDVVVEATSSEAWARGTRLKCANPSRMQGDTVRVIDDFDTETFPIVEPPDFWDRIRADGYRSMVAVGLKAREQQLALIFWSRQRGAFSPDDLPIARRIADHVALAVSHEQLAEAARQVAEAHVRADRLEARLRSLSEELAARTGYGRVVGASAAWNAVLRAATQVSETDTTVLLTGESGTGKEVVARFIHRASSRKSGPFVAINCAALPEQLLESELFGYERGAFTGAQQAKAGQLELASGGVLFLDEVSEMSPSAQAKFLRVLQEREFQRLGGTRLLKANVRVIAATNRDLMRAIERKEFREDLFYRLQVFDIRIPPLRERPADILPLSEAFLQEIGDTFGRPPAGLTRDAKQALLRHTWPGNVRELRNALERAVILSEGSLITPEHLSVRESETPSAPDESPVTNDVNAVERAMIARVLRDCDGNKSKAAKQLGLSRTQLYGRLRKYQLA